MLRLAREAGFENAARVPSAGHPAVFGTLDAGAKRTLGVYFMYDVKQVDPAEWSSPPFEAALVDKPGLGARDGGARGGQPERAAGGVPRRAPRDPRRGPEAAREPGADRRGRGGDRLAALHRRRQAARRARGAPALQRRLHAVPGAGPGRHRDGEPGRQGRRRARARGERGEVGPRARPGRPLEQPRAPRQPVLPPGAGARDARDARRRPRDRRLRRRRAPADGRGARAPRRGGGTARRGDRQADAAGVALGPRRVVARRARADGVRADRDIEGLVAGYTGPAARRCCRTAPWPSSTCGSCPT